MSVLLDGGRRFTTYSWKQISSQFGGLSHVFGWNPDDGHWMFAVHDGSAVLLPVPRERVVGPGVVPVLDTIGWMILGFGYISPLRTGGLRVS